MVLRSLETALERLVEGTFSRAFKAELQPVELGRQLIKEMSARQKVDVDNKSIVPNQFEILVAQEDHDQLAELSGSLNTELVRSAHQFALAENHGFVGPIAIKLERSPEVRVGQSKIEASFKEPEVGAASSFVVELSNNPDIRLFNRTMSIGRHEECDIVLDDENISRRHAELQPHKESFLLVDLGSTNGCKVNGERHNKAQLWDGDEVTLGPIRIAFRYQP